MSEIRLVGIHPHPGPEIPSFLFASPDGRLNSPIGSLIGSDESFHDPVPKSSTEYPVFFSANINSLTSKLELVLKPLVELYQFPLLALQETKLDSGICSKARQTPPPKVVECAFTSIKSFALVKLNFGLYLRPRLWLLRFASVGENF